MLYYIACLVCYLQQSMKHTHWGNRLFMILKRPTAVWVQAGLEESFARDSNCSLYARNNKSPSEVYRKVCMVANC